MKPLLCMVVLTSAANLFSQQIVSPEVAADGRVTFRFRATNANTVQLRCEGMAATNLLKGDAGVWSFTTEPLEPDIYVYSFTVDGVQMIDPRNPFLKYNLLNTDSQVHVPGPKALPWEINDVPRGRLHRHFYRSAVAGDERDFIVYTPPDYDPSARRRYPVLYLLHGFSDDQTAWTSIGRAHVILDNLVARGRAKPMLIVMPLGYGSMDYVRGGWTGARRAEMRQASFEKFRENLLTEVIPQTEKSYKVAADRKSRAIAGLSMGGSESLFVGLNALDKFAWIGAFSSGGLGTNFASQYPALDEKANGRLHLLWVGCGVQDNLIGSNRNLSEWLKSKGVRHTWVETPGAHSFRVWRRYLSDFLPLLFQEKKQPATSFP
jgi:enterochelin esterase family protein